MKIIIATLLVLAFAATSFAQPMTPDQWDADDAWKQHPPYVTNADVHCSRYQVHRRHGIPDAQITLRNMYELGAGKSEIDYWESQILPQFETHIANLEAACRSRHAARQ